MSLWSGGGQFQSNIFSKSASIKNHYFNLNLYKVCALALLRLYGEVHLVTDKRGAIFLKKIPFTTVDTSLENLPKNIDILWSLGKIYTYKIMADKGEPFFHVDHDLILGSKLPEDFINSEVFASHHEYKAFWEYEVREFYNIIINKYYMKNILPEIAYNTCIFGGRDLEFIKHYSSEVMRLSLDEKNIKAIQKHLFSRWWSPACIIEQYGLSSISALKNKNITTLLNVSEKEYNTTFSNNTLDEMLDKKFKELNCFHLMGKKHSKEDSKEKKIINAIGQKVFN